MRLWIKYSIENGNKKEWIVQKSGEVLEISEKKVLRDRLNKIKYLIDRNRW